MRRLSRKRGPRGQQAVVTIEAGKLKKTKTAIEMDDRYLGV